MISVQEVVNDPDFAQLFIIQRSNAGFWQDGVWVNHNVTLQSYGSMQPASDREIQMVPEGDRVTGMLSVWSSLQLFTTGTVGPNDPAAHTSDILVWHGQNYRIMGVKPWFDNGYWRCLATRMLGE